ncbi:MAG: 50S ribosomal protein L29 [Bacteroidetes bacterium]|nr:50S ribosomal protein L29 [Bacteroidota bacterium]
MKVDEIRELSLEELRDKIDAESLEYQKMVLTHSITPLENSAKLKKARRTIARYKTELRAREINQNNA